MTSVTIYTEPKKLKDSKQDLLMAFLKAKKTYKDLEELEK